MTEETLRSYAEKNGLSHWTLKNRADSDTNFPAPTRELAGARVYSSADLDKYLDGKPLKHRRPWYVVHAKWAETHSIKRRDPKAVEKARVYLAKEETNEH